MSDTIIRKGTTLTLTTGCYSDYSDHGPFVALKDFDKHDVSDAFLDHWKSQPHEDWDRAAGHDFISWLASNGYIEDVAGAESWHVGDYDFEPEFGP